MSPNPQADSRLISKSQVIAIYSKPESEWTEQEREDLRVFHEEEERKRIEREEAKKKAREQGNQKMSEYWVKMQAEWKAKEEAKRSKSLDWFMSQMKIRAAAQQSYRITEHADSVPQYVEAAYRMEVAKRGMQFIEDGFTANAIRTISRWLVNHTKPGLMLRGYIGVGKTTMMYAIADVLQIVAGKSMKIFDARRIASVGKGSDKELYSLADIELMGIDDLGTEPLVVKSFGNEVTPVGELLTERYNKQRFTIITTNLAIVEKNGVKTDELLEVYGDRLFDRFKEMFNMVNYDSSQKSYRK